MKVKTSLLLIAICALAAGWIHFPDSNSKPKQVIGQTAEVTIEEAGMDFIARVDTGAASTSVHAEALRVDGDMVDFELVNRDAARLPMRMPVAKSGTVRNAGGSGTRVFVEMTVRHEGRDKRVLVSLSERDHMTYALLLGRNWLKDDYIVDVSHQPMDAQERGHLTSAPTAELQNLASNE
jgi:hypothetical protein